MNNNINKEARKRVGTRGLPLNYMNRKEKVLKKLNTLPLWVANRHWFLRAPKNIAKYILDPLEYRKLVGFASNKPRVSAVPMSISKSWSSKPPKKTILFEILGAGCKQPRQSILSAANSDYGLVTKTFCNPVRKTVSGNIVKTVCRLPLGLNDPFIQRLVHDIERYINNNYKIILFGYSYGGSVASRVAEYLTKYKMVSSDVIIHTFGSIYVPPPEKTSLVNITHHMFTDDVALRCNHLNPTRDTFVKWLKPPKNAKKGLFNFTGSANEWFIHNDYFDRVALKIAKRYAP